MPDRDDRSPSERKVSPGLIAGIVVALLALAFVLQNSEKVEINFLFFNFEARVWTVLLITSVLAIVAAELIGRHLRHRKDS